MASTAEVAGRATCSVSHSGSAVDSADVYEVTSQLATEITDDDRIDTALSHDAGIAEVAKNFDVADGHAADSKEVGGTACVGNEVSGQSHSNPPARGDPVERKATVTKTASKGKGTRANVEMRKGFSWKDMPPETKALVRHLRFEQEP